MTANKTDYFNSIVELDCGHTLRFIKPVPKPGEILLCFKCDMYRVAVRVPNEISAVCNDCNFARQYGTDRDRAIHGAGGHIGRKRTHTVLIFKDGEVLETITPTVMKPLF